MKEELPVTRQPTGLSHLLAPLLLAAAAVGACNSSAVEGEDSDTEPTGSGAVPSTSKPEPGSSGGSPAAPAANGNYRKEDYPSGPYGTKAGSVIENLSFLGWRNPAEASYDASNLEEVRLSDFYNPDGRSDVKLLVLNASAIWCSVCRAEMADFRNKSIPSSYLEKGVQVIGTLFEDKDNLPAKPADLTLWGTTQKIDFPLLLDPGFKMGVYFTSDATPVNLIVDARTMKIVQTTMGYDPTSDYWQRIERLASGN